MYTASPGSPILSNITGAAGRTIHETLDLFEAAQTTAGAATGQSDAIAVLLDFRKSYDSLDRSYLIQILRRQGFPDHFTRAIEFLHTGTRVQFLAKGGKSRHLSVHNGIRQGCPLAPLLFILALDPLYRKLDGDPTLHGVHIQSAGGSFELRVGGYADDTAVYLQSACDAHRLLQILDNFGQMSGLQINETKTLVIALTPQGRSHTVELPGQLQLKDLDAQDRYLGIQVGSSRDPEASWTQAERQLEVRLRLACQKTTTVDQRSAIVAAIIIPKLLYVGRHAWPSVATLTRLTKKIKNYVWNAVFTEVTTGSRAWLDMNVAGLPRSQGGMAIPDLRVELMAMAATSIVSWGVYGTRESHIVGDVLYAEEPAAAALYITPNCASPTKGRKLRWQSNMWRTGRHVIATVGGPDEVPNRIPMVMALFSLAQYFDGCECTWKDRRVHFNGSALRGTVCALMIKLETGYLGTQCLEWLPYTGLSDLVLYGADGTRVCHRAEFPLLQKRRCRLRDILHWRTLGKGRLLFTVLGARSTHTLAFRTQIEKLVTVIVLNFPRLLYKRIATDEVRYVATPVDSPLLLTVTSEGPPLLNIVVGDGQGQRCELRSHHDLIQGAAAAAGKALNIHYIHPHPRVSRMVCLWVGQRRWSQPRRRLKRLIQAAAWKRGVESRTRRLKRWVEQSTNASSGLEELQWKTVRRITGLGPWGEQVLLRLKLHAFSVDDITQGRVGCPHSTCIGLRSVDLNHIFWECPAARQLRQAFTGRWRSLGLPVLHLEHDMYSLHLRQVPPGVWELAESLVPWLPQAESVRLAESIQRTLEYCWRLGAAIYFQGVWRWRVEHFDSLADVKAGNHTCRLITRLRAGYETIYKRLCKDAATERAMRVCRAALSTHVLAYEVLGVRGEHRYLLFFDGGSRGNPGPGGCGTAIVRVGLSAGDMQICWAASMSLASTTMTNNLAENLGLLTGLRACQRNKYRPLHVIGDSAMIIRQHSTGNPPLAEHLRKIYWTSKRIADKLCVRTWRHHLRAYNKTADALANMAMDTCRSVQCDTTTLTRRDKRWKNAFAHMASDVGHWLAENLDEGASGLGGGAEAASQHL